MPDREQRVSRVWLRIEGWLREHAPEVLEALGEGASDEKILAAEEALELELPPELRHTLRRVDGIARPEGGGVLQEWELLSVEGVVQQYRDLMDLYERGVIPAVVSTRGPANPTPWTPQRIPFGRKANGDLAFVDMDPAVGGNAGQVVRVWRRDDAQAVEARDLVEFLETIADEMIQGRWQPSAEGGLERGG